MTKEQIVEYIMSTPYNTNWNVLSTLVGEGDWDRLKFYIRNNSASINKKVIETLMNSDDRDTYIYYVDYSDTYVMDPSKNKPLYAPTNYRGIRKLAEEEKTIKIAVHGMKNATYIFTSLEENAIVFVNEEDESDAIKLLSSGYIEEVES